MSSERAASAPAIAAQGVGKCYNLFDAQGDRLKQLLWGRWRQKPYYREFWALRGVDFEVAKGEVLGIVGRNGAGKSTLLQMVCGTLQPNAGTLTVNGRVAALLELGAGFNPDFTGRENVYMNAAILGLSRSQVDARLDDILAFADIGSFIDQPVKTYSSGMFMRLAFSVATSVEPDILVIDEALSVGDGAFSRKSFDRIMSLKDAGKTILFCSHSMYQVEALCSRALWIEHGALRMAGSAAEVTAAYGASLDAGAAPSALALASAEVSSAPPPSGSGRLLKVTASAEGAHGNDIALRSGLSDLTLVVEFTIDPRLPPPGVAVGIADSVERTVASAISVNDGVALAVQPNGQGRAMLTFGKIPLLKGRYSITVFLTTEDGVHPYDQALHCVSLQVTQHGFEQGVVTLPHVWHP